MGQPKMTRQWKGRCAPHEGGPIRRRAPPWRLQRPLANAAPAASLAWAWPSNARWLPLASRPLDRSIAGSRSRLDRFFFLFPRIATLCHDFS